ncbi:winged helix-turn-helix domain-containing protein [Stackebrandtia soli]|uniref:winged helix-turn-helix domain-containing protein n=1 Tax=Stackebrandtia soli TaxID=1892856 RepID=UPI0039ED5F03
MIQSAQATDKLTADQARRIALAAQGMATPRPSGKRDARHLRRVLAHTQLLQIDSVYVLERAHYMPVFSRIGPYPHQLVNNAAYSGRRELFEYWGHAASLLPVELYPALRWRMDAAHEHAWAGMKRIAEENPGLVDRLRAEVAERGPVSARQLEEEQPRTRDNWGWNWSDTKQALEWLFQAGQVSVATRVNFERFYDLPERVIPAKHLDAPALPAEEAHRVLLEHSGRALGVATDAELRDYFRLSGPRAKAGIEALVEEGTLTKVTVEGWDKPAYLHAEARIPRRVDARALLSPFDPLVWHRDRTMRLWNFHYRIEIYVPAAKRVHGYYVLPFLLGEHLVARVDLKADRARRALVIPAVWLEAAHGERVDHIVGELAAELRSLASWLGLDTIEAPQAGDLAPALTRALAA